MNAVQSAAVRPALRRPSPLVGLWLNAAANSFGRTVVQLALSWMALELTGSPFVVGVVAAARMAPQIPLGIPAGILADWVDRRKLVVGVTATGAVVALCVAALLNAGALTLPAIVAVAVAVGLLDTLRTTATQAYAYDLVHASHAARGLAFVNLGAHSLGTLGGLAGGYTLQRYGAVATFAVVVAVLAFGAAAAALGSPARIAAPTPITRARPSLRAAGTLILRSRLIALLVVTIVVAEILGFSSQTVLPTFARDVYATGAAGLGTMTAARSMGAVLGLLFLTRVGTRNRSGAVLLTAAGLIGLALLAFSLTSRFELALLWLALVGAACAVVDTLSQMLLQQSVDERQRGAAMGTWVVSIGFGPVGHLALGALAASLGAPPALALFGATLTVSVALLSRAPALRRLA